MGSCFVLVYGILVYSSVSCWCMGSWCIVLFSNQRSDKVWLCQIFDVKRVILCPIFDLNRVIRCQIFDLKRELYLHNSTIITSGLCQIFDLKRERFTYTILDVELSLRSNRDLFNSMIITNGLCVVFFSKKRPIHQHNLGQKWTLSFLCALQEIYIRIWSWV